MEKNTNLKTSYNTYIILFACAILYATYEQYYYQKNSDHINIRVDSGKSIAVLKDYVNGYKTNFSDRLHDENIDKYCEYYASRRYPIAKEALKLGFIVDESEVEKSILQDKRFLNGQGNFIRKKFNDFLKKHEITEFQFREFIKIELLIEQYDKFIINNYAIPSELNDLVKRRYLSKRSIVYSVVNENNINVDVSKKKILDYYRANIRKFDNFEKAEYNLYKIKKMDRSFIRNMINYGDKDCLKDDRFKLVKSELVDDILGNNVKSFDMHKGDESMLFYVNEEDKYIVHFTKFAQYKEADFNDKRSEIEKSYIADKKLELAKFNDGDIYNIDISSDQKKINKKLPRELIDRLFVAYLGEEHRISYNGKIIIAKVVDIVENGVDVSYNIKEKIDNCVLNACHDAILNHEINNRR